MSRNFVEEGHFVCECGREFSKSQSYYAHCSHCKIHLDDRYDEYKHNPAFRIPDKKRAWAKGHTMQEDTPQGEALRSTSEKNKGKKPFLGHTHSEEFKKAQSVRARYNASNHINGWKAGSSKIPNKYETFAENFLKDHDVPYAREVVVPQSLLGKKGSYYQLDFLVSGKIDLEIDGSSHNGDIDKIRDSYVCKLYEVYRINHNDSMEVLETLLNRFLECL